jgi:hypothetical protein
MGGPVMGEAQDVPLLNAVPPGALTLDHVAHFVPDMAAASAALDALGFQLTPFSVQSHRLQPDGPLVPAGTANRCIMFERGYLEVLTPTAETPLAEQLRTAIQRYVGIHLIAFGTSSPETDYARLESQGFTPLDPVALQRPISTESGESTARFTVVRVPPPVMPEGRIQYCHHRTPELMWQRRWLTHPNGTKALNGVVVCASDPQATAARYARYTGLRSVGEGAVWRIDTQRGALHFVDADVLHRTLGVTPPALPFIAGVILESNDLANTLRALENGNAEIATMSGGGRAVARLPVALGGVFVYECGATDPLFSR